MGIPKLMEGHIVVGIVEYAPSTAEETGIMMTEEKVSATCVSPWATIKNCS
jgi:hypothetical protein